jgi:hypothetical protein
MERRPPPAYAGTKDGRRQALFFQFGRGSSTALPRGGDWRCLPLDGQELEACVDEIDVEVPRDL